MSIHEATEALHESPTYFMTLLLIHKSLMASGSNLELRPLPHTALFGPVRDKKNQDCKEVTHLFMKGVA